MWPELEELETTSLMLNISTMNKKQDIINEWGWTRFREANMISSLLFCLNSLEVAYFMQVLVTKYSFDPTKPAPFLFLFFFNYSF